MTKPLTKTQKLVNALESGQVLTSAQIENRTGLKNVSATINRLRDQGKFILTTENRKGEVAYTA